MNNRTLVAFTVVNGIFALLLLTAIVKTPPQSTQTALGATTGTGSSVLVQNSLVNPIPTKDFGPQNVTILRNVDPCTLNSYTLTRFAHIVSAGGPVILVGKTSVPSLITNASGKFEWSNSCSATATTTTGLSWVVFEQPLPPQ